MNAIIEAFYKKIFGANRRRASIVTPLSGGLSLVYSDRNNAVLLSNDIPHRKFPIYIPICIAEYVCATIEKSII